MSDADLTKYVPDTKTWLRAIVSSIPMVGSALDHLLFDKADGIRLKNVELALEGLAARLKEVQDTAVDKTWFQSEEALAAVRLLTEKVSFEPDKQKVEDLARVTAGFGVHPQARDDRKLSVLEHLSRLSPVQMRLVQVLSTMSPQTKQLSGGSLSQTITALWPENIKTALESGPRFWEGQLNILLELEVLESLNTVQRVPVIVSNGRAYLLSGLGTKAAEFLRKGNLSVTVQAWG